MVCWKVFVLSIVILSVESRPLTLLIAFGNDASIEDFPYQASLRKYDFHFCGATIISEKHVLTAAHCLFHHFEAPYSELTVNTGTSRRDETGHVHKVDGIIIHPDFSGNSSRATNDIAIITLKGVIVFDMYQQKINLPKQEFQAGEILNLTGWGWTQGNPTIRPNQLQVLDTILISRENCQRKRNNSTYWGFSDTEICSRTLVRGGVCDGDSGGPVVANGEIVGIVSWTYGSRRCGGGIGSTDVHTNVYKFVDFIKQHVTMSN